MLIASDIIRKRLIGLLTASGIWEPWSVMPNGTINRYIYIGEINEIEQNSKTGKIVEGSVNLQITERFLGKTEGTMANVDAQARAVVNILQPSANAILGNFETITIFSTNIEASNGNLFEVENGRVAIRNLRLMYRAQAN